MKILSFGLSAKTIAEPKTLVNGASVALAIEIASTNWRDDYELRLGDYEQMGVREYWIANYLGIVAARHIGKPKRPTLTICLLGEDAEFTIEQSRGDEVIVSQVFPGLLLTVEQVLGQAAPL